jgi:acyl-CoA thioester hydrolase
MSDYRYFFPINVSYSDIDAQGHVNNTRYGTYIESARLAYLQHLGLWDGKDFHNLGVIVADVHITYRLPLFYGQQIEVGARVSHIGGKSMKFEFTIRDIESKSICATAETINVGFDYTNEVSTPISDQWRKTISEFEGRQFS